MDKGEQTKHLQNRRQLRFHLLVFQFSVLISDDNAYYRFTKIFWYGNGINIYYEEMLDSISCSFASISFLTHGNLFILQ